MPNPQIPEIFPIVAAMVGWATDQRVKTQISPATMPFGPDSGFFYQLAIDLETVMETTWHVNTEERELERVLWDAFVYGTGFLKTNWDTTLLQGQGDAIIRRIDPFTVYPDPDAKSDEDWDYVIEAKTMSLQELDRRFPGAADKFGSGGYTDDVDEAPTQLDTRNTSMPRANPAAIGGGVGRYGMPGAAQIHAVEQQGITVLECWMRDHTYYETKRVDTDGNSITDRRVNDEWRVVVIAGNHVLMDERADELWEHAGHPYDRFVPHDMGEFWGFSLVEMLSPTQESINRVLSAMQQNVELTGNPVFLEETRAGLSRTQITNKPGQRLRVNNESGAKWLPPPSWHQGMPELLRYYLQRMEAISGLSAITKGGAPQGRNAQGVVDAMQEASFVRVRMILRNLEWAVRSAFTKKASLITEFYTAPRYMAVVGSTGQRTSMALSGRHFYTPSEKGGTPMKFQLLVNAGSASHTSRKVREDQAVMLFTMGAIDEYALLEALEFPNWVQVGQRTQQLKAAGLMQPPGARQRAQH